MEMIGFKAYSYIFRWFEIPYLFDFELEVEDDILTQIGVLSFLSVSLFLLNLFRKNNYNTVLILWTRKMCNKSIGECYTRSQMNKTFQKDQFLYSKINAFKNHNTLLIGRIIEFLKEKLIHGILKQPTTCGWKDNLKRKHDAKSNLFPQAPNGKPQPRSKFQRNSQKNSLLLKGTSFKENLGLQLGFTRTNAGYVMINNSGDEKSSVIHKELAPGKITAEYCKDLQEENNNYSRRNKNENVKIKVFKPEAYTCTDPVNSHSIDYKNCSTSNQRSSSVRCYSLLKSLTNEVKKNTICRIQGSVKNLPSGICWTNKAAGPDKQHTGNHIVKGNGRKITMECLTCTKSFTPIELTVRRRRTKDSRISSRDDSPKVFDDHENKPSSPNSIKDKMRSEKHESYLKQWTNKLTEMKTVDPIVFSLNKDEFSTTGKRNQLYIIKKKEPNADSQLNLLRPEIQTNKRLGLMQEFHREFIVYRDGFRPYSVFQKSYSTNQDVKRVENEIDTVKANQDNGRLNGRLVCPNSETTNVISRKETEEYHESCSCTMIEKGGGDFNLQRNNVQCNICKLASAHQCERIKLNSDFKCNEKHEKTDCIFSLKIEDRYESSGEKKTFSPSGTNIIVYDKVLTELKSRFKKAKSEKSNYKLENLFNNAKPIEAITESQMTLAMSLKDIKTIERLRKKGLYFYHLDNHSCTPPVSFLIPKNETKNKFEENYSTTFGIKQKQETYQRYKPLRKPIYLALTHGKSTLSNEKTKGSTIKKHLNKNYENCEQCNHTRDENRNTFFKRNYKRKKLRTCFQRIYDRKYLNVKKQNYCSIPECRCGGKFGWLEAHQKYVAVKDLWFYKARRYCNFSDPSSYNNNETNDLFSSIS